VHSKGTTVTALPDVEKLPPVSRLHELFRYDPVTGKLFWRPRKGPPKQVNQWNSRNADKEAGWLEPNGYRRVIVDDEFVLAHRVVWALAYGVWPLKEIDHEDQNRSNNVLNNLQDAGPQLNNINKSMARTNKSGCTGVYQSQTPGKWKAQIKLGRQNEYLGTFGSFDDAVAARKQAEKRLGFSPNHGRARA
jgi:hypothetical protein